MVKRVAISLCLFLSLIASGQELDREGIVAGQATISPGVLTGVGASTISVHGDIEYFIKNNISFRGDAYYFLNYAGKKEAVFEDKVSVFAGISYFLNEGNSFAPFVGVYPGIGIASGDRSSIDEVTIAFVSSKSKMFPILSVGCGFYYFASNWFHLFGQVRMAGGSYYTNNGKFDASELTVSFGLGFNLNTKKNN